MQNDECLAANAKEEKSAGHFCSYHPIKILCSHSGKTVAHTNWLMSISVVLSVLLFSVSCFLVASTVERWCLSRRYPVQEINILFVVILIVEYFIGMSEYYFQRTARGMINFSFLYSGLRLSHMMPKGATTQSAFKVGVFLVKLCQRRWDFPSTSAMSVSSPVIHEPII